MTDLFSVDLVGVVGGALAAACVARRAPMSRRWTALARAAAAAAAVVVALSANAALLAVAWVAASVMVSARDRPTDLRTAIGVFGDALAAATFVLLGLDAGEWSVPWAGGPVTTPEWAPALFAAGVSIRAVSSGMREPGLLVLTCVVGAHLSAPGLGALDAPWLVALAPVAAIAAWAEGPLAGLPVLAAALWGVAHPAAVEGATLVFAGAGLASAGVAFAAAPAVGSRWSLRVTEGPPGGATAAGLALLATVPGAVGLLQVPIGDAPEAAVALGCALAVLGAAGVAVGARSLRSEAFSIRVLAGVAAATVLALALLTPGGYAEALDIAAPHGSIVAAALTRARAGLVSAGAFGAAVTALVLLASRIGHRETAA